MTLESDIRLLSRVRLFEEFEQEHLRLLAFGAETRTLGEGMRLYRQDTYSDGGYVIASGSIDLISGKNDSIVSNHTTGALIGELALITDINHAATAVAKEPSQVLKINRLLFHRVLQEYPELADTLRDKIEKSVSAFMVKLESVRIKLDQASEREERRNGA